MAKKGGFLGVFPGGGQKGPFLGGWAIPQGGSKRGVLLIKSS